MRRVDVVLASISAAAGVLVLLVVMLSAQWLSLGTLLGAVLLANAAVRFRLGRSYAHRRGRRA
jgi:hypothetical protein